MSQGPPAAPESAAIPDPEPLDPLLDPELLEDPIPASDPGRPPEPLLLELPLEPAPLLDPDPPLEPELAPEPEPPLDPELPPGAVPLEPPSEPGFVVTPEPEPPFASTPPSSADPAPSPLAPQPPSMAQVAATSRRLPTRMRRLPSVMGALSKEHGRPSFYSSLAGENSFTFSKRRMVKVDVYGEDEMGMRRAFPRRKRVSHSPAPSFAVLRPPSVEATRGIRHGVGEELMVVSPVDLHWSAPANCPRADDVRARLLPLLPDGSEASADGRAIVSAEGTIRLINGRYHLTLKVRYGEASVEATRAFESERCETLAGAAAVTLALYVRNARDSDSLDHARPAAEEPPPSSPASSSPPASASSSTTTAVASQTTNASPSTPAPEPPPAPAPPRLAEVRAHPEEPQERGPRRPWGIVLEVPVFASDDGTLPSLAYGLGGGVGLRSNRFRATLQGVFWFPQNAGTPFAGSYSRRNATLSGCYGWPVGSLELGPCVALTLEDVTASGAGPNVVSASAHTAWLTAGVGGRVAWSPAGWASFFVRPSATLTTSRPTFAIDGVGSMHQASWVAAGVQLGCEWIL